MHQEPNLKELLKQWHGTFQAYCIGFGLSLLFTLGAFLLVIAGSSVPKLALICIVIGLALMQAVAQLIFFFHLGEEPKPRWETLVFCFMVLVLLIIVVGSLWIIYDLNQRVMNM